MKVKITYSLIAALIGAFVCSGIKAAEMSQEERELNLALAASVITHHNEAQRDSKRDAELQRALEDSKKEAELKETHRKEMEKTLLQIAMAESEEAEQLRKFNAAAANRKRPQTMPVAPKKEEAQPKNNSKTMPVKKLEDCTICCGQPENPCTLICNHTFCSTCIDEYKAHLVANDKDQALCPLCRTPIVVKSK